MASTSAPRNNAAYGRIKSAASTLYYDNQTLIAEIRKATIMMKEIAVDLERDNRSEMVKELENGVLELVKASDECTHLSNTIQSIGNEYQPGAEETVQCGIFPEWFDLISNGVTADNIFNLMFSIVWTCLRVQLTNFSKLFDDKIERLKAASSSVSQNHLLLRQFREAIWNVHHAGQLMPGEEQEDIVMASTECNLLNITCPMTGKPVSELADPVRSMDCRHIYEKKPIMQHIRSKASQGRCPVAGCPKILQEDRVVCDPLLLIEIDEMQCMSKQSARSDVIEDFTRLDEED